MKKIFIGIFFLLSIFLTIGCSKHVSPSSVVEPQNYRIYSVIPTEARAGDTVTVVGEYFDQYCLIDLYDPNNGPMNDATVTPVSISSNSMTFVVPATTVFGNSTAGVNNIQIFAASGGQWGSFMLSNVKTIIINN